MHQENDADTAAARLQKMQGSGVIKHIKYSVLEAFIADHPSAQKGFSAGSLVFYKSGLLYSIQF
jgi:hypothetical protein